MVVVCSVDHKLINLGFFYLKQRLQIKSGAVILMPRYVWPCGNPSSNLNRTDNMFSPLNFTRPRHAACKVDIAYQAV